MSCTPLLAADKSRILERPNSHIQGKLTIELKLLEVKLGINLVRLPCSVRETYHSSSPLWVCSNLQAAVPLLQAPCCSRAGA